MAMEKRQPWLVSQKIYGNTPELGYDHGILHYSAGWFSVDLHDLEKMPVDMQRMVVIGSVPEEDTIFRGPGEARIHRREDTPCRLSSSG